ncbi:MAG: S9 family peptidase [Acidimicrobiia bacterium]|nr:MAG: S9 family peptidase [Acidimicrobiia bacterium]
MRPDQLGDFRVPSDAFLHPDGVRVVFVVTQMDLEEDEYVRRLWLWDGETSRQLTSGKADTSPRWSPDGETLAFLRKGPGDEDLPQVALLRIGVGEAEVVTDFAVGVTGLEWSPDGTRLALVVAEFIDGFDDEEERKRAPRRIKDPSFRFDNKGWTYNKRSHIWIHDIATGESIQITEGDYDEVGPMWSPDASTITYRSAAHDQRWTRPFSQVFTVRADGRNRDAVTQLGNWLWSGYSPEGALHVVGRETDAFTLDPNPFQRVERDGSLEQLTDLDRNLMPGHPPGPLTAPRFTTDGRAMMIVEDRGSQRVISVGPDSSVIDVAGGNRVISGWCPSADGCSAVFTASSPGQPGEVYWWDGSDERQLTVLNDDFIVNTELATPQEFIFESDGHEIHGWVYLPAGEEKVPLLLNIHGGPFTQYGWGFLDEFQVYVEAGYGVVAVNPRGSSGYGLEHGEAPCGRWSDEMPPDLVDLKTAPYAAAEQFPRLDIDNKGVMGGSYGGLATVMITALDTSYRSAVAERGVYNWVSMAGTTDIPWFNHLYLLTDMPEGVDEIWSASSLARAHLIETPTLVVHSEGDYRCPVEQGQQLFGILYRSGVDTELLLFPPDEGHELSRSGKPKHRVERFEAILEWHARYLQE